jgi:hypothetical protein
MKKSSLNFGNLSSNPNQRPKSGDFDTENAFRKATCDFIKSYLKPPVRANERSALDNIDQSQRGEFLGGFQ